MKRVVIVGMGFAGLRAARTLAGKDVDVTVLDRQNYHLFQPLLYQVASASIEQEAIAYPLRALTRAWKNVRYEMAAVGGIDLEHRLVLTNNGSVPYDMLIVAAGATTNFFGLDTVERTAHELKSLEDAVVLRNHILTMFEQATRQPDPARRAPLLTFVIVGGGPTGVEYAGALAELVRHALSKDYPELGVKETRIILLDAVDRLLGAYDQPLQHYAVRRLEQIGVEVKLGVAVSEATPDKVVLADGTEIPTRTLIWSAGVKAVPLADALPARRGPAGRIVVAPDLTLPDHPEVYVVGDMAYVEQDGFPLPMMAPVAMQAGEYAGRAILAVLRGQTPAPFRYVDKGRMAVIGRGAAVARAFGLNFRGLVAWLVWLILHLYYLVGFRNRLIVLLGWAYDYLSYDRKVRLITGR